MKKFLILIIFASTSIGFSQDTPIIGKILDNELNQEPLAFASVSVKGTDIKTNTNIDGIYTLDNLEPGEHVLVFNFIGYEPQEKVINTHSLTKEELTIVMHAKTLTRIHNNFEVTKDFPKSKTTSSIEFQPQYSKRSYSN